MEILYEYSLLIILAIVFLILIVNKKIDEKKLLSEIEPYFKFLMEDDYEFLLKTRYGEGTEEQITKLFNKRVYNGLATAIIFYFALSVLYGGSIFICCLVSGIIGFGMFKLSYTNLKSFYNKNLYKINLMLPYYLKSLEILIQHYTVPVALNKSIDTAPSIFKDGLKKLIAKIEAGDSTIEPYMDFAREYPVRDSMRMMRLLYRLSLGSQESKQEQLLMFSKNVSSLQSKAREQKYQNRLDNMEKRTMFMLAGTGGGLLLLLLGAMISMMGNL